MYLKVCAWCFVFDAGKQCHVLQIFVFGFLACTADRYGFSLCIVEAPLVTDLSMVSTSISSNVCTLHNDGYNNYECSAEVNKMT